MEIRLQCSRIGFRVMAPAGGVLALAVAADLKSLDARLCLPVLAAHFTASKEPELALAAWRGYSEVAPTRLDAAKAALEIGALHAGANRKALAAQAYSEALQLTTTPELAGGPTDAPSGYQAVRLALDLPGSARRGLLSAAVQTARAGDLQDVLAVADGQPGRMETRAACVRAAELLLDTGQPERALPYLLRVLGMCGDRTALRTAGRAAYWRHGDGRISPQFTRHAAWSARAGTPGRVAPGSGWPRACFRGTPAAPQALMPPPRPSRHRPRTITPADNRLWIC
ncbi:MAG: hypothetical protein FJW35_04665 [Acidobacteria bacterium]|nr:hypothetical protein [Acidobacteriota bacterium]